MASVRVPKVYRHLAEAIIDTFWTRPLEKQGRPLLSKAQIRQQIEAAVVRHQAQDGDPSTWTFCEHCEGEGLYYGVATETEKRASDYLDRVQPDGSVARGLCYQCGGKGRQSEADRKRNAGYQRHVERRDNVAMGDK
jgi:hypothetical protein